MKPGRYSNGTKYPVQVQKSAPYPGYESWIVGVNVRALSFMDLKAYAICEPRDDSHQPELVLALLGLLGGRHRVQAQADPVGRASGVLVTRA